MSKEFNVMLAKDYDPKRVASWKEMYVEPKLDGVRVVVLAGPKGTRFFSRNGRELDMFKHLKKPFQAIRSKLENYDSSMRHAMFDGEMIAPTFGEVGGAIHRKDYIATECSYHGFCVMPEKLFWRGMDRDPQIDRILLLQAILSNLDLKGKLTITEPHRVLDDRQVQKAHKQFRRDGFEGTMVKSLTVPWTALRSYDWMKIKDEVTVDVKVIGMKEGKPGSKYVGMCGALIVDHDGVKVRVAGMDDTLREKFWEKPKSIVGHMIEVKAQEITAAGSLRHPRFIRMRPDKE